MRVLWMLLLAGCSASPTAPCRDCYLVSLEAGPSIGVVTAWQDDGRWHATTCEGDTLTWPRQDVAQVGRTGLCE